MTLTILLYLQGVGRFCESDDKELDFLGANFTIYFEFKVQFFLEFALVFLSQAPVGYWDCHLIGHRMST